MESTTRAMKIYSSRYVVLSTNRDRCWNIDCLKSHHFIYSCADCANHYGSIPTWCCCVTMWSGFSETLRWRPRKPRQQQRLSICSVRLSLQSLKTTTPCEKPSPISFRFSACRAVPSIGLNPSWRPMKNWPSAALSAMSGYPVSAGWICCSASGSCGFKLNFKKRSPIDWRLLHRKTEPSLKSKYISYHLQKPVEVYDIATQKNRPRAYPSISRWRPVCIRGVNRQA